MVLSVRKRKLTESETQTISKASRSFPHLGLLDDQFTRFFHRIYVVAIGKKLAGICCVVELKNWYKIGPIIILDKYQGRGYGKILFSYVVADLKGNNLYIGSSNPAIWKLAESKRFISVKHYLDLPNEIKKYLATYLRQRFGLNFVFDAIYKKIKHGRGEYKYYIKS